VNDQKTVNGHGQGIGRDLEPPEQGATRAATLHHQEGRTIGEDAEVARTYHGPGDSRAAKRARRLLLEPTRRRRNRGSPFSRWRRLRATASPVDASRHKYTTPHAAPAELAVHLIALRKQGSGVNRRKR